MLFCREANLCETVVEAQYYTPKTVGGKEREFIPNTFVVIIILIGTLQK